MPSETVWLGITAMNTVALAAISKISDAPIAYVLDDENQVGSLVSRMLGSLGFKARAFSTVLPFLTEIRVVPPALVVLDLALGQWDAVEVIRHLEILEYRREILLISGRDSLILDEVRSIGEQRGLAMLPSLRKPFRVKDLELVVQSEPVMKPKAIEPRRVRSPTVDLAEALSRNWLEVWYQPKIDLKSMLVCGAEALVRARHPEHGIILPDALLPPAGDPLYRPLSRFVLRRAMADWQDFADRNAELKLSVNIPASVLNAPDFISILREYLPTSNTFTSLRV